MAYPEKSRASSPWRNPAAATGRQCWQLSPRPLDQYQQRQEHWEAALPPASLPAQPQKARLGFPHPHAITKFRMWLGRAGEGDLDRSEGCLGAVLVLQEQGLEVALLPPRFAQHLRQVT